MKRLQRLPLQRMNRRLHLHRLLKVCPHRLTPPNPSRRDVAPKFTLPSAAGESVSLESFAGDKNVVLVFYRGFW